MPKRLRPVADEFLELAPTRLVFVSDLRAKPEQVFRELTDDAATWPQWWSSVRSAAYTGPPPYGPGAGRAVTLRGGARFVEAVVAWSEPDRFAYRVEQTNVPGVYAWLEEWLLTPSASGGTVLRFTMAIDAAPAVRTFFRLARPGVSRSVHAAAARLDARCLGTA